MFENRIGEAGAKAIFDGVSAQLLKKGFIARGGQIIDATLVPAPKQHFNKDDKEQIKEGASLPTGSRPNGARRIWTPPGRRSMARVTTATSYQ